MDPTPLRLLAVLAHPDDETLGLGGTLARYASEGIETYLVTATHGQSGRYKEHKLGEPGHPGRERLAEIREAELDAAAAVLGIREVHLLGYIDGQLDAADPVEVIARIAHQIRRIRPQVVVSFAMDGGYGHPDHVAICQLATAATVVAAGPALPDAGEPHAVSKLYYMAWPESHMHAYQEAFKKLVSLVDGVEREAHTWPEWQLSASVDTRAFWPQVWKAVLCHDSQVANYAKLGELSPEGHAALWGRGTFYRAFSTVNGSRQVETDLFAGLRGAPREA
jgi:LmbE family N-acetylglucosaminyl deacetylase